MLDFDPTTMTRHFKQLFAALLFFSFAFTAGHALADAEPTLNQVYAAAQAGKLDEAQVMMQQVLISHPNSAKAHYVRAELFARQGKFSQARDSLAEAEKLAPGLPFAKPEAVRALRNELAGTRTAVPAAAAYAATAATPAAATSTWLLPLLLAIGVIVIGYLVFRRRAPVPRTYPLDGPTLQPAYPGGYAQPAPTYGQPASMGLGSQIMGGVATGLAVGAGVVAAEAIGRRLFSEGETHSNAMDVSNAPAYEPVYDANADMGGQNFGISDAGSWDDGAAVSDGGGWDS